ncbi:MAG: MATE family efflux transporter [Planctomycetota bacterium]|jgi:putative MATE family efflux protein
MLRLAIPVLIEQLLTMLVGFSDRVLTGHYLETPHLAAITLMSYVLWMLWGVFQVVAIGATAMVARFAGAGDLRSARKVTNQAFVVGAGVAALVALLGAVLGERAVYFLQLEGEAAELATTYLRYLLPAIPLIMAQTIGIACLRGAGDMVSGLIIMTIVNLVNVSVSWALVLGLGPLPQLGWRGIAIGTVCGFVVGGLLALGLLLRGRAGLRVQWGGLWPDGNLIRRLLRVGLPGGADVLSIIGCQFWFLSVINQLGDRATAAHGVAICVESMAFLPGAAFQMAAMTLTGQYLGAGDLRKASRSVLMACLVGGGLMVSMGVLFYIRALPLAQLFVRSEQADVALLAAPLLQTVSLAIPALALTMILTGALRGAGDTRWPLIFSLVGMLGVRIPAAYWLAFESIRIPGTEWIIPGCDLGVLGAWCAMVTDVTLRAALVVSRFWHGGWKRVEV